MARNEEKAMGLLNRWTTFKQELRFGENMSKKRPKFPRECQNVKVAMQIRREFVLDITNKTTQISNAALGEHRIRELNDDINRLIREKVQWEHQIRKLGGPSLGEPGMDGKTYKYYGAARELPQVREILELPTGKKKKKKKRTREEIIKDIGFKYFESCQDDNGALANAEKARSQQLRKKSKLGEKNEKKQADLEEGQVSDFDKLLLETVEYASLAFLTKEQEEKMNTSKAMEKIVVERKKRDLMSKYLV